jgi:short-subunit dehydrogenase
MTENKNIVLTGANSGIGLETLKLFVKGGNKILAVDLHTDNIEKFDKNLVTPLVMDVSNAQNVDKIFDKAQELFGDIDIFFANAGYPYYEQLNYVDWNRTERMFQTNVFSPIYSYEKFVKHLNGRKGVFALTISAIGKMAMPGYTLYSASKFAMQGFQQGIRLEMPKNVQLTCLYPVATDTNFFKAAVDGQMGKTITQKPFPVQKPAHVAKAMVKGIERGAKSVNPCKLFGIGMFLFAVCPPIRSIYWAMEKKKLENFLNQGKQK